MGGSVIVRPGKIWEIGLAQGPQHSISNRTTRQSAIPTVVRFFAVGRAPLSESARSYSDVGVADMGGRIVDMAGRQRTWWFSGVSRWAILDIQVTRS